MKKKYKVLVLSCMLANFINVQASEEPTQKTYEIQSPSLFSVIYHVGYNTPFKGSKVADCIEPTILKSVGYSNSEIYNKMVSERMFALSIAAMTCPPAVIPIALSLYTITNPREKTWTGFAQDKAIQYTIKAGLDEIIKK